ncbi:MAG: hypothetical protein RIT32_290 [Actinomycetota bacterium]|jgi:competence protein ComEC
MTKTKISWLVLGILYISTLFASFQIQSTRFGDVAEILNREGEFEAEFEIRSEPRKYLARYASDSESIRYSLNVKVTKLMVGSPENPRDISVSAPATLLVTADQFDYYRGQTLRAEAKFIARIFDNRSCCLIEAQEFPELVVGANRAFEFARNIRVNLQDSMSASFPNGDALVPGLVLGDTSAQTKDLEVAMRGSGLAHLTAVSGGNVTIVLGLFIAVFSIFGLSNRALVLVASIALAGYVLAVGFDASVMRAATMGSITLLAFLSKKIVTTGLILLSAVYLLTVFNPWLWRSWGFLLSVTATAGLIWLAPRIMQVISLPKPFDLLAGLIAATVAATWVTAPLLALMTQNVPVVSVISNLIAAPLVAITTILGLIAAFISLVSPNFGTPLSFVASLPAELIAQVALWSSNLPGAQLELGSPLGLAIFLIAIVSVIGLLLTRNFQRVTFIVVFGLVITYPLLVMGYRQIDGWPPKNAFVVACDVGQGTAVLLPLGRGEGILFDTGGDPRLVNQCLSRADISSLRAIFISHFHADHAAGLSGAITGRKVTQIFVSPNPNPKFQSNEVERLASINGITLTILKSEYAPIRFGDFEISTLWPSGNAIPENENDSSLILLVTKIDKSGSAQASFLFTGDIEPTGQADLMRRIPILPRAPVNMALVPHHGSKFQQSNFSSWTGANCAVISVGENTFGHPSPDTVSDWSTVTANRLFRTDISGDTALMLSENSGCNGAYR